MVLNSSSIELKKLFFYKTHSVGFTSTSFSQKRNKRTFNAPQRMNPNFLCTLVCHHHVHKGDVYGPSQNPESYMMDFLQLSFRCTCAWSPWDEHIPSFVFYTNKWNYTPISLNSSLLTR